MAVIWSRCLILLLALLTTSCQAFVSPIPLPKHESPAVSFDWARLQSSTGLNFRKCYGGSFECARLTVPLDWNNPRNPNNISLAIIRLPAVVDRTDRHFGGTIIINPGGPSGSGTDTLLLGGRSLQKMIDSELHFEILSFDPRGVKHTTPNVACFHDQLARQVQDVFSVAVGGLDGSEDALNVKWAISQSLGTSCLDSGSFPDGSNIHQYVSTALVARDMVEIVDKLHENLKAELKRTMRNAGTQKPFDSDSAPYPNLPLLNYYGFSYGTYLGNTFASMFPHRVGRMVLDGVVDADDYAATGWTTNLSDNMKTWTAFFDDCFAAGSKCPLYNSTFTTSSQIQEHVEKFIEHLKENPIPLVVNGNAALMTHFLLKVAIHSCLYTPNHLSPILAKLLASLEKGRLGIKPVVLDDVDFRSKADMIGFVPSLPPVPTLLRGHFGRPVESPEDDYTWSLEAAVSILCGDGDDITWRSKANQTDYLRLLQGQSELDAAVWAEITLRCVHWPQALRPSEINRFTGPFQSQLSDYNSRASPLLFIGNTADPVTPVRNAHRMSSRHEGSVVLTQDMPGHCSSEISPTTCGFAATKAFFANGTLPEPGLVCKRTRWPWDT